MTQVNKIIEEAKSTIRDIKSKGKITFSIGDDFFNQFLDQRLEITNDEIAKIRSSYVLDISDDEEPEPSKSIHLSMFSQKVFSKKPVKLIELEQVPQAIQPEKIKSPGPPKVKTFVEKKPIHVDHSTQSKKSKRSITNNVSADIRPSSMRNRELSHHSIAVSTKSAKYRNETTNTDSLLPQYETKCMEMLQSILNDSPNNNEIISSNEELSEILISLLNQILDTAPQLSEDEKEIVSVSPIISLRTEIVASKETMISQESLSTQVEPPFRLNNGSQTQKTISIKTNQKSVLSSVSPSKFPYNNQQLVVTNSHFFDQHLKTQQVIKQSGYSCDIEQFELPPPLKIRSQILTKSPNLTSFENQPKRPHLQLETLVSKNCDIPPPSKLAAAPSLKIEIPVPQPHVIPAKKPESKIVIPPLPDNFELSRDIDEISNLNLDSIMAEIENDTLLTVSDEEDIEISTLNSEAINRLINDDSINAYSESMLGDVNSSGEIKNTLGFDNSEASSVFIDSY